MSERHQMSVPSTITIEIRGADGRSHLLIDGTLEAVLESVDGVARRLLVTDAVAHPMRDGEVPPSP